MASDNTYPLGAVIFDLGRVLVDFDWERAVARIAPFTSVPADAIEETVMESGLIEPYEKGLIDCDDFAMGIIDALGAEVSIEEFTAFWSEIFIRRPEMESLLGAVRRRVPVGILSDTSPMHWEYLRAFAPPLLECDALMLSYQIGSRKPDRRNYLLTAAELKTPPERCVFVDDREENVAGAVKAGLQAFRYASPEDTRKRIFDLLRQR